MRKNNLDGWKACVTVFGLGYIPVAPGTMGALAGIIPGILVIRFTNYPNLWLSAIIIVLIFLGIIGSNKLEPVWGKDPSKIVIDETAGMLLSMLWLPNSLWYVLPAFILFRIFDIYKPLGVRHSENFKGGVGVMADDVLAGVYANLTTQALFILIKAIR